VEVLIVKFNFFRSFFIASILAVVLTIAPNGNVLAQPVIPASSQLVATNIFKAAIEKAEGKVQETVGNIKGDREAQIEGKVKQAEGDIRSVPSDARGNPTARISEAEIKSKTFQAESNIRRFQSPDRKATNLKDALQ
jgi:uncharacterized protein YjbJ (UPF0337 family)